ncbi:hypothetical protein FRC17_010659, partial [Serendipita sp. 399]
MYESIQALEARLEAALALRVHLEGQITEDLTSLTATDPAVSGLPQTLPVDLLVIVFSYVVHSEPKRIGTLLFVCRHWYSVAVNTPLLWSTIDLIGPSFTSSDVRSQFSSLNMYCRACIARSASVPLDIRINYDEVATVNAAICLDALKHLKIIGTRKQPYFVFFKVLFHTLPKLYAAYLKPHESLVKTLVGWNGGEMARWQSFTFSGAEWKHRIPSLIRRACEQNGPRHIRSTFENTRVVLQIPEATHNRNGERDGLIEDILDELFSSHLPRLRRLEMPIVVPLGDIEPSSVYEVMLSCSHPRMFYRVLRFQNLRHLRLSLTGGGIQ